MEAIVGILLFFGNLANVAILAYKIVKFSELEEDYQNPTDFAKDMNRIFPFELGLLGTLFTLQFFNAVTSTSIVQLVFLLLHTIYFGFHMKQYLDKNWKVDAAAVWDVSFKSKMKRTIFGGLAFAGLCFFFYIFNMMHVLIPKHALQPQKFA